MSKFSSNLPGNLLVEHTPVDPDVFAAIYHEMGGRSLSSVGIGAPALDIESPLAREYRHLDELYERIGRLHEQDYFSDDDVKRLNLIQDGGVSDSERIRLLFQYPLLKSMPLFYGEPGERSNAEIETILAHELERLTHQQNGQGRTVDLKGFEVSSQEAAGEFRKICDATILHNAHAGFVSMPPLQVITRIGYQGDRIEKFARYLRVEKRYFIDKN